MPEHDLTPWPGEPESLIVTVDTGDRLHYLDWGGPAGDRSPLPPLVLVHGLGATAWSWAPVARRLRSVTRVLAVDLRGHGLSDSPRSGYELESLAIDVLTVMVANGWGRDIGGPPAAVAGHGLGALVGATMAVLQPQSVAALALADGGWEDLESVTRMSAAEYERSIGDPPEVLASMDAYLADRREFDPPSWDGDQERAARAAVDEKYAGHVTPVLRPFALQATVGAMFDYRPIEALTAFDAPLLVTVSEAGTADDEVARERLLALDDVVRARIEAGLSTPDIRHFRRVGHNLMRYRPAELSAALLDLLRASAHQRS
jgi:pimeloyl-ACP methyl ester carboxylesterase